jgi:DNA-binding transcriptional MerR regulator
VLSLPDKEMLMAKAMLSTQEIITKYNISYQTVNYYTNLGLLMVRKRQGNSRLYGSLEVKKALGEINRLKNAGYSLKLIRDILRK